MTEAQIHNPCGSTGKAQPSEALHYCLVDFVNLLLHHKSGDAVAVAQDLVSVAAAIASWRGTTDETAPVLVARAMAVTAQQLDPDAKSAPIRTQ